MSEIIYTIPATDQTLHRYAAGCEAPELDGTAAGYKLAMRRWFQARGCDSLDSAGLTALVDEWYEQTRDNWCGGTEFYLPDVSAVTYGTKVGDNADLTCEPSTDTVEGADDYAGLPLFACVDCNFEVDADTLEPVITAIDGVTDGFRRTDTGVFVGVLQMAGWFWYDETDSTYTWGYSSLRPSRCARCEPLMESVRVDGTVRGWVVHGKYGAAVVGSKLTCCKGVIPRGFISHNTCHTYTDNIGTQYSGTCACDDFFLKLMVYIKYASLTLDGIIQGGCNYSYQYPAQVAEEGVTRVLISSSHSLEVGMGVLVGDYAGSTDRGSLYATTGQAGAVITAIESETVDDEEYAAVYLDVDGTFDVAANGAATEGTTYLSTYAWPTGTTDRVLANDGSMTSNTSGRYPGKVQGIECMTGTYEVVADSILSLYADDDGAYWYEPCVCRTSASQATSITDAYEASGAVCEQDASTSQWSYIKRLSCEGGVAFPVECGGSSSTYTRDAFYRLAATEGTREWLARGSLSNGSADAGLSCARGGSALSRANWYYGARLSASGNRGEWTA